MSPERAIQIAAEHDAKADPLNIISAILAACREERRAALTEAAEVCQAEHARYSAIANSPLSTDVGTLVHDGMSVGAENSRIAILALRDKEQP